VVLAFLRGELDSHRFGAAVRAALDAAGGPQLVATPDLNCESQNRARAAALTAARDWRANRGLFSGFPDDVTWYHGILDLLELCASSTTRIGWSFPEDPADPQMFCQPFGPPPCRHG
jgi:hypothetical protein